MRSGKNDPVQERQRLTKLYSGMSDGELEKVGKDPAEDWVFEVLGEEMMRRGLDWPGKGRSLIDLRSEKSKRGIGSGRYPGGAAPVPRRATGNG